MRGRDIKRYHYEFADLYLITTFPSRNYNIDDYPAIKQHLLNIGFERLEQSGKTYIVNGETIKARKKTSNKWFETQDSISYWDDFSKQKIVYREISEVMDACLVEPDIYLNNKCYFLTGEHLEYLLCIFNSKLFNKMILSNANLTGGKGCGFLGNVKIPYPNSEVSKRLKTLYYQMQEASDEDKELFEDEIENCVFDLYNITTEERAAINQ